jgi:Las17-binding protein actin regulator
MLSRGNSASESENRSLSTAAIVVQRLRDSGWFVRQEESGHLRGSNRGSLHYQTKRLPCTHSTPGWLSGVRRSVECFLQGGVKVPSGLPPIGSTASMQAQTLSYSGSKGVFDGVSLSGTSLEPDDGDNETLYGKKVAALSVACSPTFISNRYLRTFGPIPSLFRSITASTEVAK